MMRLMERYLVSLNDFNEKSDLQLNQAQKETVDKVMEAYGCKSPQWLGDQIRSEMPYIKARLGIEDMERCNHEITLSAMAEYYS